MIRPCPKWNSDECLVAGESRLSRSDCSEVVLMLTYELLFPGSKESDSIEKGVAMNGSEDEVVAVTGGVKLGSEGVMGVVMLDADGSWVPPRTNWSWLLSSAISGEAVEGGVVESGDEGLLIILIKGKKYRITWYSMSW